MQFKSNSYLLLGVEPTATIVEIKKAFWQKSKLMHPDLGGTVEDQIELNHAYEILVDPRLKKAHDRFWKVLSPDTPKKQRVSPGRAQRSASPNIGKNHPGASQRTSNTPTHYQSTTILWEEFSRRVKDALKKETEGVKQSNEVSLQAAKADFLVKFKTVRLKWGLVVSGLLLLTGFGFLFNFLWSGILIGLYILYQGRELILGDTELSIFDTDWKRKIEVAARRKAQADYEMALAAVSAKYERLFHGIKLLKQPARFTDAENELAQRIILAFYLSGYRPVAFEPDKRLFIAARGALPVVIRYRQRKGSPANVAYVKELYQHMLRHQAGCGFLFAAPGLSAQAADFAGTHRITTYALETMNDWLTELGSQEYAEQATGSGLSVEDLAAFVQAAFLQAHPL